MGLGPTLMGQAGKETPYIIPCLVQGFHDIRVQYEHPFLMFSSMTEKSTMIILVKEHGTCLCFSCSGYLLLSWVFLLTS